MAMCMHAQGDQLCDVPLPSAVIWVVGVLELWNVASLAPASDAEARY